MHSENVAPVKQSTGKASTGLGTKARGVAEVIHGGVESIRGSTLGTSNTVVGRTAAATKNDELAKKGRLEMDRGLAKLKGPSAHSGYPSGAPPGRGAHDLPDAAQHHNFPHDPQNTGQYPPTSIHRTHQISPTSHQPAVQQPEIASTQGPNAPGQHVAKQIPPGQAGRQIPPTEPAYRSAADRPGPAEHHASTGETVPQTIYPGHHRDDGISGLPQHQLNDIQAHHTNHPDDQVYPRSVHPPTDKTQQVSTSGSGPDLGHHRDESVSRIPQDPLNNTLAGGKLPNEQPKVVLPSDHAPHEMLAIN